jgi:hypothetical protein
MKMALRVSDEGPKHAGYLGPRPPAFMQAARHAPLLASPPESAWRQIGEGTGPCGPMMRLCWYRRPSAAETPEASGSKRNEHHARHACIPERSDPHWGRSHD